MQVVWDLLGSTSDKESACNEETWVQSLGQEDSLKERMAIHFIRTDSNACPFMAEWKILKEMGIPDHLTRLLRNLHAGKEATVRTGHGTTDCFQIGKGISQGCILSP